MSERGVGLVSHWSSHRQGHYHTVCTLTVTSHHTQLSRHLNRLQAQLELLTPDVPPLPTLPSFTPSAQVPIAQTYAGNQVYAGSPAGQYAAYNNGQYVQNAAYPNYGSQGESEFTRQNCL